MTQQEIMNKFDEAVRVETTRSSESIALDEEIIMNHPNFRQFLITLSLLPHLDLAETITITLTLGVQIATLHYEEKLKELSNA